MKNVGELYITEMTMKYVSGQHFFKPIANLSQLTIVPLVRNDMISNGLDMVEQLKTAKHLSWFVCFVLKEDILNDCN